jgi:cytochrome c oxidase cbb3-type subunit III
MSSRCLRCCLLLGLIAAFTVSCERREAFERRLPAPGRLDRPAGLEAELQPGVPFPPPEARNPYEGDASAIAEGRRLYRWYNCVGCHFNGGGGMGPPFIDGDWIYGREPANIFNSIVRGRPNGMPAYGGRIPERQVWQIAAYVQTLDPRKPEREPAGARVSPLQEEAKQEKEQDREGVGPRGGRDR